VRVLVPARFTRRTAPRDEERRPGDPRLPRRANDGAGAMISSTAAPDELLLGPGSSVQIKPRERPLSAAGVNTSVGISAYTEGTKYGRSRLHRGTGEGGPLRTSNEYQQQAIRCLRLAQTVDYPPSKAVLLDLAEQWAKTARQARDREAEGSPSIHPMPHPEG
jgi:hypothetical protein